MDWNLYILFWICILGLCLGSFYNVVILRSLSNESIVFPPSKCPKCNHKLYAWHNIPVISYILLGGKCYFCKEKISIQYPIIELLTMILFALFYIKFGISITTLFVLCWVSALIIMTVTDLKEKLVDCNIPIFMAISGIIYNFLNAGWNSVLSSIMGIVVCVIILETTARIGYLFVKTRAMGEADTYVAGAFGAIFGLKGAVLVLLYSFALSMLFIIPMFLYLRYKNGDKASCLYTILFILSVLAFEYLPQNYITLSVLICSGCAAVFSILKGINKAENLNYIPFVPVLSIGALIGFWSII